jgi:hypothetical protein
MDLLRGVHVGVEEHELTLTDAEGEHWIMIEAYPDRDTGLVSMTFDFGDVDTLDEFGDVDTLDRCQTLIDLAVIKLKEHQGKFEGPRNEHMLKRFRDALLTYKDSPDTRTILSSDPQYAPSLMYTNKTAIVRVIMPRPLRDFLESHDKAIMDLLVNAIVKHIEPKHEPDPMRKIKPVPKRNNKPVAVPDEPFSERTLSLARMPLCDLLNELAARLDEFERFPDVWVARGMLLVESGRLSWNDRTDLTDCDTSSETRERNVGCSSARVGRVKLDGVECFYKEVEHHELCKAFRFSEVNEFVPNTTQVLEFAAIPDSGISPFAYAKSDHRFDGYMICKHAGTPLTKFDFNDPNDPNDVNRAVSFARQMMWASYCIACWLGEYHSDPTPRNFMVDEHHDKNEVLVFMVPAPVNEVRIPVKWGLVKFIDVGYSYCVRADAHHNVRMMREKRYGEIKNLMTQQIADALVKNIRMYLSSVLPDSARVNAFRFKLEPSKETILKICMRFDAFIMKLGSQSQSQPKVKPRRVQRAGRAAPGLP